MDKEKDLLEPAHVDWLVEHRAATQRASAKLYRLLIEHEGKLAGNAQLLVGVAYSLWRSVFLSDKTSTVDDTRKGALKFLAEILQNNAIAYSQERNSKDWTFNYYANNARYRLLDLQERWPEWDGNVPGRLVTSAKNRWKALQACFESAVDHFEIRLKKSDK